MRLPRSPDVTRPRLDGALVLGRARGIPHVGDGDPAVRLRRIEPMDHVPLGEAPVSVGPSPGSAPSSRMRQRHEVEGDRLDRAPLGAAGMLNGVGRQSAGGGESTPDRCTRARGCRQRAPSTPATSRCRGASLPLPQAGAVDSRGICSCRTCSWGIARSRQPRTTRSPAVGALGLRSPHDRAR